ncbi:hypothetical protein ABIB25_004383 [Nakamurella sp. UYEF19]
MRGRGKSRAYAPTVWDLVMDGSHAAATQAHLPPAVDEDRDATAARRGQRVNLQVGRPAGSAGLASRGAASVDVTTINAGQEPCRSCRSHGGCSQACSVGSPRHEVSRRPGVKPASDEPSTSTKNWNPPPHPAPCAEDSSISFGPVISVESRDSKNGAGGKVESAVPALVEAVRGVLPPALARQLIGRALERRCAALAVVGWTADQASAAVRSRSWDGAGAGAVIAWLADLCQERPVSQVIARRRVSDRASGVADLAEEYRQALKSAAASDSPARAAARRVVDEAAARARERRASSVW